MAPRASLSKPRTHSIQAWKGTGDNLSVNTNLRKTQGSIVIMASELFVRAKHSENEDHGIRSHHFMGNRWGNSGNSVRLFLEVSKITADGDCSHEIKRRLLLGRKVMTNLDSILKSRDITLATKVCLVKAMVFPVVMYGCESWTVKKAEH